MIAVLNTISLNIVHQKLFYITEMCMFFEPRTKAQHVLPEQMDNAFSSFARKTYKFTTLMPVFHLRFFSRERNFSFVFAL